MPEITSGQDGSSSSSPQVVSGALPAPAAGWRRPERRHGPAAGGGGRPGPGVQRGQGQGPAQVTEPA